MKLNDTQRMAIAICPVRIEGIDGEPTRMTKKDWIALGVIWIITGLPCILLLF